MLASIITLVAFTCALATAFSVEACQSSGFISEAKSSSSHNCPSPTSFRRKTPLWIILGKHNPVETCFKDQGSGNFSCLYRNTDYPGRPPRSDMNLAYCHYNSDGYIDREGSYPGQKGSHVDCPRRAHVNTVQSTERKSQSTLKEKRSGPHERWKRR